MAVHNLPRLHTTNVNRFNETKWLYYGKGKKQAIFHTNNDTNYADNIALLANTHAQAKSLLHSQEKAASGIGLHVNADKMEYMCFNQNLKIKISTLKGGSLKLVDKFTYIGSSISSTKNDINTWLTKAVTAIDRLLVIWRSDLSEKIKHSFFPGSSRVPSLKLSK